MDHSRNQGERQDGSPSDATFFRMEVARVERTLRDCAGLTEDREYEVILKGTDGARFIFTTGTPPAIDALFDVELMDTSEGGNRAIRRASVLAGTHLDTCNAEVEQQRNMNSQEFAERGIYKP